MNFLSDVVMKTHQRVIEAEGADVIGRDVALSERLRYLRHYPALIYEETQRWAER